MSLLNILKLFIIIIKKKDTEAFDWSCNRGRTGRHAWESCNDVMIDSTSRDLSWYILVTNEGDVNTEKSAAKMRNEDETCRGRRH